MYFSIYNLEIIKAVIFFFIILHPFFNYYIFLNTMVPWHYCGIAIKLGIKSINQSMCRSMGFSHGATSVKQTFLCNNFSYRTRCNKCRSLVLVPWKIMRTVKGQKDSVVRADHSSHVCRTCDRSFFSSIP